jgi:hypothetical protein
MALGAAVKGMSGMSIADMQATVDGQKPTGVAGFTEQAERYNYVRQAAQQIITARNADPRQAVIDNKLGSTPLDFRDFNASISELKGRIAAESTDATRFGIPVPLLSNQEASQLSQRFQTMKPVDQARTMYALNQGLGNDRGFQNLMHQIMPGAPVVGLVGSQLGQGNPKDMPVWNDSRFARNDSEMVRTLTGDQLLNPQGLEHEKGMPKFTMPEEKGSANTIGLRDSFNAYAGAALGNRAELAEATYAAFRANYAARLAESGNYSGKPAANDDDLRRQSLRATVGNTVTFNHGQVVVPPGMDPTHFEAIANAAVAARAKLTGMDPKAIAGFKLEEVGAVGSGRYVLLNGNALVTNPGGKVFPGDPTNDQGQGLFQIDLRNQYLPSRGVKPTEADARRQAAETPPPQESTPQSVPGQPQSGKERLTGGKLAPGPAIKGEGGRQPRAHPSQAEIE